MKTQLFIYFLLIPILFLLSGCKSKIDEISNLVENGKFKEAKNEINNLSVDEKGKFEIKGLLAKVKIGLLITEVDSLNSKNDFSKSIQVFLDSSNEFVNYSSLQNQWIDKFHYSAKLAAEYYLKTGEYEKASAYLIESEKYKPLDEKGKNLLNQINKLVLNGTWRGVSNLTQIGIVIKINTLTTTTFNGTAFIEGSRAFSPVQGGFFDGKNFSATMIFYSRMPLERSAGVGLGRQIVGYIPDTKSFSLSGTVENKEMKLTIDELNAKSYWTLKKLPPKK